VGLPKKPKRTKINLVIKRIQKFHYCPILSLDQFLFLKILSANLQAEADEDIDLNSHNKNIIEIKYGMKSQWIYNKARF
jgi:hypothetical protein